MGGMTGNRRQLLRQQRNVVRAMLGIQQDPVKTGSGNNLRRMRIGQRHPKADQQIQPLTKRFFERVHGCRHEIS